jgi:hypothetical protein
LIKRLRSRGLIPAAIVTVLVGAAAIVPSALASSSPNTIHGFLTAAYCTGVSITPVPSSVAHSTSGGTHVTATATGTGCTTSPRYEFWLRPATSSVWQLVQAYGTSNTYDWNSTGADVGTVYLGVHVKDVNSTAAYDAVASNPVTVTGSVCTGVTIVPAPTSVNNNPTSGGTHVIATASATGCTTTPKYEFWIRPASVSTWTVVQAYSATATYDWNSSGALPGTVYLGVHAKDAGSSAAYDVVASTPVTVNASQCGVPTITPVPTTVVHSSSGGTHVIATASTSCTNAARYEFWIRPASSSTWQLVQAYSATATYDWNSTGAAVGTVYLGVHVKDVNSVSSAGYDNVASTPVTVT